MLTKGERTRGPHGMMAPARNLSLYLAWPAPSLAFLRPLNLNRIVLEPGDCGLPAVMSVRVSLGFEASRFYFVSIQ